MGNFLLLCHNEPYCVFSLHSLPTLPSCSPHSHPCLTASQAWRPLGVGFCDGNHGPRQSLYLQRSHQGVRPRERPRGTDLSCARDHRNRPQSTGRHICLHLHIRHLKERLQLFVCFSLLHTYCLLGGLLNVSGSIFRWILAINVNYCSAEDCCQLDVRISCSSYEVKNSFLPL